MQQEVTHFPRENQSTISNYFTKQIVPVIVSVNKHTPVTSLDQYSFCKNISWTNR